MRKRWKKYLVMMTCLMLVLSCAAVSAYAEGEDAGIEQPGVETAAPEDAEISLDSAALEEEAGPDAVPEDEAADLPVVLAEEKPQETATLTLRNGLKQEDADPFARIGVPYTLTMAGLLEEKDEGDTVLGYYGESDDPVYLYVGSMSRYAYGDAYHDITYEITDEVRTAMQEDLAANGDQYDTETKEVIREIIDHYKTVELKFGPITHMMINIGGSGIGYTTYAFEEDELSYDEDELAQSSYVPYIGTYKIGALEGEDAVFVKWIKDGEDYSTDKEITVTLDDKNIELVAVFEAVMDEPEEDEDEPADADIDAEDTSGAVKDATPPTGDDTNLTLYIVLLVISILALAGLLIGKIRKRS